MNREIIDFIKKEIQKALESSFVSNSLSPRAIFKNILILQGCDLSDDNEVICNGNPVAKASDFKVVGQKLEANIVPYQALEKIDINIVLDKPQ